MTPEDIFSGPFGSTPLTDEVDTVRRNYIQALKNADNHDFTELVSFVRS